MVVVWIAAVVAGGLILGIVGFGLVGQLTRLRRAVAAAQNDVQPRTLDLLARLPGPPSAGRHRNERQVNAAD